MIFLTIVLSLVLVYFSLKFIFWKRQNLPNVLPTFLGQTHVYDGKDVQNYGKVFGTYDLLTPVLVVTKPDLINKVLVESSDCFSERKICMKNENMFKNCIFFSKTNEFESQRNVIRKIFSNNKNLIELTKHYMKSDSELMGMLTQVLNIEQIIDFQAFISIYSMRKYLSSCFGTAIDQKIKSKLLEYFQKIIENESKNNYPKYMPKMFDFGSNDKELWKAFTLLVEEVYDNRRTDDCKNSLLFMLSDANDSNILSKSQVMENALMFCVMGFKTSLTTLSHLIYCLAINQSIQQKLIKEIDKYVESQKSNRKMTDFKCSKLPNNQQLTTESIGDNKENVENEVKDEVVVNEDEAVKEKEAVEEEVDEETVENERQEFLDAINGLEYLDACIKESLRLLPPVPQLRRTATKSNTLDKIHVPRSCRIIIPVFEVHTDPDNYSEPTKFNPDRFLSNGPPNMKDGTYIPFGDGSRDCQGIIPSLLEIKLCMINILSTFRFIKCSQTKEMKYNPNNGLFSSLTQNEVMVKLIKRNKNVLD